MRLFRVRIDLKLLGTNLSKEDGRSVSEREVADWLRDADFEASGDSWIVRESNLGQLDPSEVLSAEVVDDLTEEGA